MTLAERIETFVAQYGCWHAHACVPVVKPRPPYSQRPFVHYRWDANHTPAAVRRRGTDQSLEILIGPAQPACSCPSSFAMGDCQLLQRSVHAS